MVRLEANSSPYTVEPVAFQFLVVRLEVPIPVTCDRNSYISIPCGTIRRFVRVTRQAITLRFQFLVVRLEDRNTLPTEFKFFISIPCGTIRRFSLQ